MSTVYEYKTGQFVSYPIDSYTNDGVDSYANEVIERFWVLRPFSALENYTM